MATIGFLICLMISIGVLIVMATKNYENINIYDWTIMLTIPVILLAYWLKSRVTTPEAAELAFCFLYLDSTLLIMVTIFAMLHSFGVNVKAVFKVLGYGGGFVHAFIVWFCFNSDLYYRTMEVSETIAGSVTKMTSGPLKVVHIVYLLIMFVLIVVTLLIAYVKKGTHSRRILHNYTLVAAIALVVYAIESLVDVNFSYLPYLYVFSTLIIAINYDHRHMHDIACIVSQQQKYYSKRGYVALDLRQRFMSCNEKAFEFVPALKEQRVDEKLPTGERFFSDMIFLFQKDGTYINKYPVGEKTYVCEVSEISVRKGGKIQGFLFDFRDATEEQKTLDVMTSYNETLYDEIEKKTENIISIQQKITVGMANIIENRDNNTGGHVKRTSDVIQIIVDEIRSSYESVISEELAESIVRAAPMHDLGKISIDSNILCKPGRLTDEEYDIMKTHSTKSGEMVHILLDGVEEPSFVQVAFNIARYHHERWDGGGYPDGLVGSMIPLEARIMSVADVYDALVSERCYKKPMSFQQASEIMCQGMGSQFDPNMKKIFLNCREKLEAYYRKNA